MTASAVVFGYHEVGVRCLSVLLAAGIDVKLVLTHEDDAGEHIWFDSVAVLAKAHGITVLTPPEPSSSELQRTVAELAPDFVFSFYYRHLIPDSILAVARRGALNMHGSLLPRYRGRAPVNWAVIRGESQTGASLHYMTSKADAGDLVDQLAVPILPDDSALDVFRKVTWAAELVLWRALPALVAGSAPRAPQDASLASYFGRRSPDHGRIAWHRSAEEIHNLVRGVAPPYPGAFFDFRGQRVKLVKTVRAPERGIAGGAPRLVIAAGACFAICGDGRSLRLLQAEAAGKRIDPLQLVPRDSGETTLA
ncbi:MAG: formyltransferase [Burkholderiales bacterium]|nr:formyltransferase [Burkholderiales bacterium]